jgi:hypothetical protein
MKINYHKIDLMAINTQHEKMKPFLDIFQCVVGDFHMKYLGIPLHFEKLKRENLQSLIDSLLSRMAGWRGKLLSSEAKKGFLSKVVWPASLFTFYPFLNFPNGLFN